MATTKGKRFRQNRSMGKSFHFTVEIVVPSGKGRKIQGTNFNNIDLAAKATIRDILEYIDCKLVPFNGIARTYQGGF